jgi:hypothetical protein
MIVTSTAPLRRFRTDHTLHILNRFSVPLIIKGREMMRRGIPLIKDIGMAAFAALGCEEES